jgi:hypothetical protein
MPRSRRSTPQVEVEAQSQSNAAGVKTTGKEKTCVDGWAEPAVASQPSYHDHHGAPFGVLEHMQPLGEAPNAKVKGRVKSEAPRKSVLGRSSAVAGLDAQETPEGTPAPQATQSSQVDEVVQPPIVIDDEHDGDYAPGTKKKAASSRPKPTSRRSDTTPGAAASAPTPQEAKATSKAKSTSHKKTQRVYDDVKLKRVVEAAKSRAMDVGKPDLAEAVHEIWQESLKNQHLTDLLEAILTQKASKAQTEEFQQYVKRAKKRLKDTKAKDKVRKSSAANTNGSQSLPLRSPSAPTPTARQLPDTATAAIPSTEPLEATKPRLSIKVKSPKKESHADYKSVKSGKMSASPPKPRTRAGSESSELTDLTSEGEGEMDMDAPSEANHATRRPTVKINDVSGKDHAAERGSLAAPDRKLKRSSADANLEDDDRERELAAKKQKLSQAVQREVPHEVSDVRSPVRDGTKQRLTRQKNGSLLPPPISLPPISRAASARGSRGPSMDLDSPLSELSPSSSRMSTPRALKVPPKPMGKRAKTKNSYVNVHFLSFVTARCFGRKMICPHIHCCAAAH